MRYDPIHPIGLSVRNCFISIYEAQMVQDDRGCYRRIVPLAFEAKCNELELGFLLPL